MMISAGIDAIDQRIMKTAIDQIGIPSLAVPSVRKSDDAGDDVPGGSKNWPDAFIGAMDAPKAKRESTAPVAR